MRKVAGNTNYRIRIKLLRNHNNKLQFFYICQFSQETLEKRVTQYMITRIFNYSLSYC